MKQRPGGILLTGLFSHLSLQSLGTLPRDGTTYSGLVPLTSINNQEKTSRHAQEPI